eukprot:474816-Amorphochlora_amoeboformis.AAC.2
MVSLIFLIVCDVFLPTICTVVRFRTPNQGVKVVTSYGVQMVSPEEMNGIAQTSPASVCNSDIFSILRPTDVMNLHSLTRYYATTSLGTIACATMSQRSATPQDFFVDTQILRPGSLSIGYSSISLWGLRPMNLLSSPLG